MKTPGRVKEHAQQLDCKIASLSNEKNKPSSQSRKSSLSHASSDAHSLAGSSGGNSYNNTMSRVRDMYSDSTSVQLLEPLKKQWIQVCSDCNLVEMKQLLQKTDGSLAGFSDYLMGYTALHWAAKFNRLDVIKLLMQVQQRQKEGQCSDDDNPVDMNKQSHSGATPLHIAAQYGHEGLCKILMRNFGKFRS